MLQLAIWDSIWPQYEQLSMFSFSFTSHILAKIKICHNWVCVSNFLVTFLLLTTNSALSCVHETTFMINILLIFHLKTTSEVGRELILTSLSFFNLTYLPLAYVIILQISKRSIHTRMTIINWPTRPRWSLFSCMVSVRPSQKNKKRSTTMKAKTKHSATLNGTCGSLKIRQTFSLHDLAGFTMKSWM